MRSWSCMNCSRAGNARHRTPRRPPRRATSLHHRQSEQFSPSLPGLLMPSRRRSTNCSNLSVTRARTHTHTHTRTHARTHTLAGWSVVAIRNYSRQYGCCPVSQFSATGHRGHAPCPLSRWGIGAPRILR